MASKGSCAPDVLSQGIVDESLIAATARLIHLLVKPVENIVIQHRVVILVLPFGTEMTDPRFALLFFLPPAYSLSDLRLAYEEFCAKQASWLEDYALFRAPKAKYDGAYYLKWPAE